MNVTRAYEIKQNWTKYDKSVAECQLANYGCIYLDRFGCPIDDENVTERLFS